MYSITYTERYKEMLKKDKPSKEDLKTFKEAVKRFKKMYPKWKDEQKF